MLGVKFIEFNMITETRVKGFFPASLALWKWPDIGVTSGLQIIENHPVNFQ